MFRVVLPLIIRSAYNCIYRIWYLSHRDVWQIPDAVDAVVCAPDDGWKYHPKHVEQFPDINKLCNVASCWIYIGTLLGAHYIIYISRIRVNLAQARDQWRNLVDTIMKLRLSPSQYILVPAIHPVINLIEITNKMRPCSRIYYSSVTILPNMFRATHRSSSGAQKL